MTDTHTTIPELEPRLRRAATDLRERLRARRPGRVEEVLALDPALAGHPEAVLELVYTEWLTRDELGDHPDREDLYRRFPALADRLARLFQVHDEVQTGGPPPAGDTRADRGAGVAGQETIRFEILGELGRGGMGVVYQARQTGLGRRVALKRVHGGQFADPGVRDRFRAEAEAVARLQHPNIVQLFEVGEQDGEPYLAMELVPGTSLAERLRAGPLPPRAAAELVEALASAVQHAHDRGVLHRDLKPANVLLAEDGTPKITDFGLARRVDGTERLTGTGHVLGTPGYMAPEQTHGRDGGPAVDVYALGAVLYEALTGRPPFAGATPVDTLLLVRVREPVPPRQLQPGVPRDLETVCLRCLQKEPDKRYPSAGALADDLRLFRDGRPVRARPNSRGERAVKWARRNPTAAALAVVLAVGATAVTLLWLRAENAVNELTAEGVRKEAERERADRHRYLQHLSMAGAAWSADNADLARQLLGECDPARRDDDWGRLDQLCRALRHVSPRLGGAVARLAVRPDGGAVAAVVHRKGYVWDLTEPIQPPRPIPLPAGAFCHDLAWSAEGEVVAMTEQDRQVSVVMFSLPDGPVRQLLRLPVIIPDSPKGPPRFTLDFNRLGRLSPDGRRLAVWTGQKAEIELHDLRGGPARTLRSDTEGPTQCLAFSADGRWLAAVANRTVLVWDLDVGGGPYTWTSPQPLANYSLAVGPTGTAAVIRATGNAAVPEVLLVDVPAKAVRHALEPNQAVTAVALSPDGRTLAVLGAEKAVPLWEAATGQRSLELRGSLIRSLTGAFSADGHRLATAGSDGTIRVWDVPRGAVRE